MTRIGGSGLVLGALLWLTMLLETNAFTTNTPLRSPFHTPQLAIRRFATTADQDSSWPEHTSTDLLQEGHNVLGDIMEDSEKPKASSRLPWIFMAVALLQTHLFKAGTMPADAGGAALATVSTTLLRSRRVPKLFSAQQILTAGVLSWQVISNLGNFISWMQLTGSAFSVWYMSCLTAFPIYTKALTSGLIGLSGDTAAQFIEERIRSRKEGTPTKFRGRYDRRRGLTCAADGMLITGPLLHFAYNFLETLIPVSGAATGLGASLAAISQVLIDDFILDAFFVGIMFVATGLGEGYKMRDIAKQFRKDYVGAIRTSWSTSIILMPMEFVLFRFFPLHLRVLGMNFIDIIWEGMVSYLVHKRRRNGAAAGHEGEIQSMHTLLNMDHAVVPAH